MLKTKDIYIDLGTSNTLIYVKDLGLIINEPTLVVKKNLGRFNERTVSLGALAKQMLGRTPENFQHIKPLHEGVISNLETSVELVQQFLKNYKQNRFWHKPRLLISLPAEVASHERIAIENLGLTLGAGQVILVNEPLAAAVGEGIDVLASTGTMIVDIGGGTTEAVILSLVGIVVSAAIRIGGDQLTQDIIQHLRIQYNFLVGESTAEALKIKVATLDTAQSFNAISGGLDLSSGLPVRKEISSEMLYKPINSFAEKVLLTLKKALEECPPEIASDIFESGICLTGGTLQLHGLQKFLSQKIKVQTYLSKDPLGAVSKGGIRLLQNPDILDKVKT
jgi:rod shape-determining protein MreB